MYFFLLSDFFSYLDLGRVVFGEDFILRFEVDFWWSVSVVGKCVGNECDEFLI